MNRENRRLLMWPMLSDAVLSYLMLFPAYWLRFYVLRGFRTLPFANYMRVGAAIVLLQIFTYATLGVYRTSRVIRIRSEIIKLLEANLLVVLLLLGWLFLGHNEHYSRGWVFLFFALSTGTTVCKHALVQRSLRRLRGSGKNLRHVLLVGAGESARKYLKTIQAYSQLGYQPIGYIAGHTAPGFTIPYLGGYEALENVLERTNPDKVISAIELSDYERTPLIIACCEKAGVKLSIIPFYADYMPAHPQFDDLYGVPLLDIRRIPLDNFSNAFLKRAGDIAGALLLLVLLSPLMLVCAVGVKLSSPGPILFRQERIGKDKKPFTIYKFRSLRVNAESDTAWSRRTDPRRTRFGTFLRRCSLDELPQLFNVLGGSMSLVGPRPEIPHYVDLFREEIPLYMVRHQVRPGITGWAQIHGYRGDTPIRERVEHDIWYIENWSFWLDIRILLATVFKGAFINREEAVCSTQTASPQDD